MKPTINDWLAQSYEDSLLRPVSLYKLVTGKDWKFKKRTRWEKIVHRWEYFLFRLKRAYLVLMDKDDG